MHFFDEFSTVLNVENVENFSLGFFILFPFFEVFYLKFEFSDILKAVCFSALDF